MWGSYAQINEGGTAWHASKMFDYIRSKRLGAVDRPRRGWRPKGSFATGVTETPNLLVSQGKMHRKQILKTPTPPGSLVNLRREKFTEPPSLDMEDLRTRSNCRQMIRYNAWSTWPMCLHFVCVLVVCPCLNLMHRGKPYRYPVYASCSAFCFGSTASLGITGMARYAQFSIPLRGMKKMKHESSQSRCATTVCNWEHGL